MPDDTPRDAPRATPRATPLTPLFPLQSVLFPDGLLPLRIFEVRYLDMITRCHKAGEPFGVVCLTEGADVQQPAARTPGADGADGADGAPAETYAREAFHGVGTLARIDTLTRPQAGLLMVRCTGMQRFRVQRSERLKHGLWMGEIELIAPDAEVAVPDDLAATRSGLQKLLLNIERNVADPSQMPLQAPYRWDDCGWLANRWCELLPIASAVKQRFMTLDNPLLRLELVADALEQIGFKAP